MDKFDIFMNRALSILLLLLLGTATLFIMAGSVVLAYKFIVS